MKRINIGVLLVASCIFSALGAGFAIYLRPAEATRNSAGTYSLYTPGNPIVTGTASNATTMNNTLTDIGTALTDSLDRNGKGGMLAALRGIDGTVVAPAFSWTSETGSGLYRIGASNPGFAVSGSKRQEWSTTGTSVTGTLAVSSTSALTGDVTASGKIGIGGAPTAPLTLTQSGTAANDLATFFEATLGNGNNAALRLGKANTGASDGLGIYYQPSATAANSKGCLAISGQTDTLCLDGNNKVYIGASGTGTTQMNYGTGTFNGGTPATFTATVASGAKCFATKVSNLSTIQVAVAGTTLTVTSGTAADTTTANWFCL